jgi:hypothetical protein
VGPDDVLPRIQDDHELWFTIFLFLPDQKF